METLRYFLGLFIIYMAVFHKRKGESKIEIYSKDWLIVVSLIVFGIILATFKL